MYNFLSCRWNLQGGLFTRNILLLTFIASFLLYLISGYPVAVTNRNIFESKLLCVYKMWYRRLIHATGELLLLPVPRATTEP